MLSADVSWRCEPGINRAYVWLSDGTVAGYRDLNTGVDHSESDDYLPLMQHVLPGWLATFGLTCAGLPAEPTPPVITATRGFRGWLSRRKRRRSHARAMADFIDWRLDRPSWKVPTDPPHGGWRDLVRNDAGQALWQRAAQIGPPRWFELSTRRELRVWTTGALGEQTVAAELWRIARPGAWRYIHSVPVGNRGSDIDHVLIGPGGVFTLNTKAHRNANIWVGGNTFMVNGHRQPYLRNSRHEATRASRLLTAATGIPVNVHPIIVVVDPRNITLKNPPLDVSVVTRRRMRRWVSALHPVLSDEEVASIFNHARRSTTWT